MHCTLCGQALGEGDNYCINCGAPVSMEPRNWHFFSRWRGQSQIEFPGPVALQRPYATGFTSEEDLLAEAAKTGRATRDMQEVYIGTVVPGSERFDEDPMGVIYQVDSLRLLTLGDDETLQLGSELVPEGHALTVTESFLERQLVME